MSKKKKLEEPTDEAEAPARPDESVADVLASERAGEHDGHHVPGTVVLTLLLLASFAVYYFANWKALADVWHVR